MAGWEKIRETLYTKKRHNLHDPFVLSLSKHIGPSTSSQETAIFSFKFNWLKMHNRGNWHHAWVGTAWGESVKPS
ncbi:MAG: hypothetical protein ACYCTY_15015, partial [Sulfuricella sp.]